jgi:hypothetical protein
LENGLDAARIQAATRKVFLHVPDRVGLGETLAWQIRGALAKTGRFDVLLVNGAPGPDDHPLLLAGLEAKTFLWTPVYTRCVADVRFAYATDTSSIALDPPASITMEPGKVADKFQLRVYGTISVDDTSWGLISLPAFRRMITASATKDMADVLTKAIDATVEEARTKFEESGAAPPTS